MTDFTLADLESIVTERGRSADPESYTAKLLGEGVERCAKKFGEEAIEATLAAVSGKPKHLSDAKLSPKGMFRFFFPKHEFAHEEAGSFLPFIHHAQVF